MYKTEIYLQGDLALTIKNKDENANVLIVVKEALNALHNKLTKKAEYPEDFEDITIKIKKYH